MKKYILLLLFFLNLAFVVHEGKLDVTVRVQMCGQSFGDEGSSLCFVCGKLDCNGIHNNVITCSVCGQDIDNGCPGHGGATVCASCGGEGHGAGDHCQYCSNLYCVSYCQTCPCGCTIPFCSGSHCDNGQCTDGSTPCGECGECGCNGDCINACALTGGDPCECFGIGCIDISNTNTKEADKVDCPESASQNTNKTTVPYNSTNVNSQASSYLNFAKTDNFERSFSITENYSTGEYSNCCTKTGSSSSYTVPFSVVSQNSSYDIVGAVHTHPSGAYSAPSAGDIYALYQANGYNNNFANLYVIAADGSQYVLTIEDPAKFATFVSNYPATLNFDATTGGFKGLLYNSFDTMKKNLESQNFSEDDAFAYATAGLLEKLDSGVKLLRNEVNVPQVGLFKEIHATPSFNGVLTYNATKCK